MNKNDKEYLLYKQGFIDCLTSLRKFFVDLIRFGETENRHFYKGIKRCIFVLDTWYKNIEKYAPLLRDGENGDGDIEN